MNPFMLIYKAKKCISICPKSVGTRDVHLPKPIMHIAYSSYFHKICKIPPITAKFINFPMIFIQFTFFASPYFDHDAFTHHALHVMDAPDENHHAMQVIVIGLEDCSTIKSQKAVKLLFIKPVIYYLLHFVEHRPMIQQKLAVLSKAGLSKDDFDEAETKHLQV